MMAILGNDYGPKAYPLVLGVTMPFGTIVGAIGPVVAGYVRTTNTGATLPVFGRRGDLLCQRRDVIFAKPPVKPRRKHAGRDKIAAAASD